jgi:hypothetical protein
MSKTGRIAIVSIIVVVVLGVVLLLPLSSTILGTFSISASFDRIDARLTTVSYTRIPLMQSYWAANGNLSLPIRPIQNGPYTIEIAVRYGTTLLLNRTYTRGGEGIYSFKVLFLLERGSTDSYNINIRISVPYSSIPPVEIGCRIFSS